MRATTVLDRHIDEIAHDLDINELTGLVAALAEQPHVSGTCDITIGDGSQRRLHYELRRSMIPNHHVWILGCDKRPGQDASAHGRTSTDGLDHQAAALKSNRSGGYSR